MLLCSTGGFCSIPVVLSIVYPYHPMVMLHSNMASKEILCRWYFEAFFTGKGTRFSPGMGHYFAPWARGCPGKRRLNSARISSASAARPSRVNASMRTSHFSGGSLSKPCQTDNAQTRGARVGTDRHICASRHARGELAHQLIRSAGVYAS